MNSKLLKNSSLILTLALFFFFSCNTKGNAESEEETKSEIKQDNEVKTVAEDPVNNKTDGVKVKIKTTMGDVVILLYNETPLHQKNFIKLVKEKFYNGVLFHRVIKDFMIQAGDPDSKKATKGQRLGNGGPGYTIDAEFNPKFFHKKGALSAARQGDQVNPEKKSSGSQFYIVQGKKYSDMELGQIEAQLEAQAFMPLIQKYLAENPSEMAKVQEKQNAGDQTGFETILNEIKEKLKKENPSIEPFKLSAKQKEVYRTLGGTPFLDANYTVFGEVLEGLEIIDKIAVVATDGSDRPLEDVKITAMELLD